MKIIFIINLTMNYFLPIKPSVQVQLYAATASLHVPPFKHGFDQHSSQLISQLIPV